MVISFSNVGMDSLVMAFFLRQVWYTMSSVFTRSKGKIVFMLHETS